MLKRKDHQKQHGQIGTDDNLHSLPLSTAVGEKVVELCPERKKTWEESVFQIWLYLSLSSSDSMRVLMVALLLKLNWFCFHKQSLSSAHDRNCE